MRAMYFFGRACTLAFFALLIAAAPTTAGITDQVKSATLPNGLRVLVLENHKAPVAAFSVFYKVGSRNEQVGKTGLSHLLEHLMFRGTKKLKPEEFSAIIQENGGMDNAFTTADFTDYFETINRDHLEVPISLEADRMANFEPKGFDSEKQVVMEERRLRTEDNPDDALSEVTQANAYLSHPYRWPVVGWMPDLRTLTLADATAYHQLYYSPQNALIVAVGDFDSGKLIKQISESFGTIRNGPKPPPVGAIEPEQQGERRVTLKHAAEVASFAECYHVPNYRGAADSFALEIVAGVLAGGNSARLHQKLVVEKQMVTSIDSGYEQTAFDPTLFWVAGQVRQGVKTEDVVAEVDKELAILRDGLVEGNELQKVKNQEQAGFVFEQDSVLHEAMTLGTYELLGDYRMLDRYLDGINKVTAADVQRVARQYLIETNRTLGILVPTGTLPHPAGGRSAGPISHSQAEPEID